jgi:hypothetical protein
MTASMRRFRELQWRVLADLGFPTFCGHVNLALIVALGDLRWADGSSAAATEEDHHPFGSSVAVRSIDPKPFKVTVVNTNV